MRRFLLIFALSLLSPGCTELPPVAGFTATPEQGKIRLTWTNPDDAAVHQVVVVRALDSAPADPTSGTEVYRGKGAATHLDGDLEHGKRYAYAAFALDADGDAADPATASATCSHDPFTLTVMPDTQYLSLSYFPIFNFNTQWIVEQKKKRNIVFTLHEGDITHNNTDAEWKNASIALSKLDGEVPYALNVGNHDMKPGGSGTAQFNKYFPLSKFAALPHFGGSYPAGKMDSAYYLFTGAGTDWLILSLIYDPPADVLAWADAVVARHPRHRVIVLTHAYLGPSGKRTSPGERIWKGLVARHAGMTLTFNGHYIGGVAARLVSDGDKGNKVYQMFTNYQHAQVSGYGMMRLLKVDRVNRKISVESYAPIKDWALTDAANRFELTDVALGPVK